MRFLRKEYKSFKNVIILIFTDTKFYELKKTLNREDRIFIYLLSFSRFFQFEKRNVMNQGGVVESGMNENLRDVDLLVTQGFGSRADVILAQPNFQDVADVLLKWKTGNSMKKNLLN